MPIYSLSFELLFGGIGLLIGTALLYTGIAAIRTIEWDR
jgi:hypothetical protein